MYYLVPFYLLPPMFRFLLVFLIGFLSVGAVYARSNIPQTADLPLYVKVGDLPSGQLTFTGSESMNPLLLGWASEFGKKYPQVTITIQGGGSARAAEALMETPKHVLAPMSHEMTAKQVVAFREKYGYDPTAVRVALDAVAIYVNAENPITSIPLSMLERIFHENTADGVKTWAEVGLQGSWATVPIHPFGRDSRSGTYQLFQDMVLRVGGHGPAVSALANPWDLIGNIARDRSAIGYSGIGVQNYPGVKLIPIAIDGKFPIEPTRANCLSGDYPLARSLYIYNGNRPGEAASSIQQEFFRYIFSQEGQNVVVRQGMFALQASMAAKMLRRAQGKGINLD